MKNLRISMRITPSSSHSDAGYSNAKEKEHIRFQWKHPPLSNTKQQLIWAPRSPQSELPAPLDHSIVTWSATTHTPNCTVLHCPQMKDLRKETDLVSNRITGCKQRKNAGRHGSGAAPAGWAAWRHPSSPTPLHQRNQLLPWKKPYWIWHSKKDVVVCPGWKAIDGKNLRYKSEMDEAVWSEIPLHMSCQIWKK
jgi:hypothetical protein